MYTVHVPKIGLTLTLTLAQKPTRTPLLQVLMTQPSVCSPASSCDRSVSRGSWVLTSDRLAVKTRLFLLKSFFSTYQQEVKDMLYLNRIFACVCCNSYQKKTKVKCGINGQILYIFLLRCFTNFILSEILYKDIV